METAKRKFTYTSRYAYGTHTDRIRTHGNGPLNENNRISDELFLNLTDDCLKEPKF